MLNINTVVEYVKDNLAFPFMKLEMSDEEIADYIKKHTRVEFSYYVPQVWKTPVNLNLDANKVPGIANEWYIHDPEGLEILNVINFYTNTGELYLHGHPPIGPLSMGEVGDWALAVNNAMTTKMFSSFDYTFEFRHPNIIRISPLPSQNLGTIIVEYERVQPEDLSGVPNDMQQYFKKLALADIMMVIGRIRKKYGGNLRTPFGEIPLEAEIYEEGKDMKREVIEIFERLYIPNVKVVHG